MSFTDGRFPSARTATVLVSWLGAALLVVWTITTLATYAVVETGTVRLLATSGVGGFLPAAETVSVVDGPIIGGLWMTGTVLIVLAAIFLRRLVIRLA